ncbi:DNA polymerase III [Streptomyces sp. WAC04189]|uniref:TerD family protein n=2 Tax=Streptomyces TaxID=1883 RepID=UPI000FA502CB|nr:MULTISPECIES: TerD family protein [unclassified Streptomyces]MBU8553503.1 TerD family protein [Streptomyces sp. Osf17]MBU8560297.1 TerD family protein [Streptomyces sp. Babs14]RSS04689.1 DNA polymerase III [Streptomyces sp. WAC04189]
MSVTSAAPGFSPMRGHFHEWALVDVETSGLVPRRDRVLSLAVMTLGPDGEQTGEYSTLLNPGCDPGPVHVHGLTAERLRGAPVFEEVAEGIAALLEGRVLVAHNAQFDYDFLAHEFARAGMRLPVARRLCTLALNRRVDPPTDDLTLGTLAAHYGVPQVQAHDALDDTRVLAGVLRASLREAARLDVPLPLVACPPRQDPRFAPKPPKAPCAFRNPGRLTAGGPLVQGMKVAVTGDTRTSRADLLQRGAAAGLNMMTSVSRHTSALVTNDPTAGTAKARRALAEGVPLIDEEAFLRLLGDVRAGTSHEETESRADAGAPAPPAVPAPRTPETADAVETVVADAGSAAPVTRTRPVPPAGAPKSGRRTRPRGPLTGRRVLVLGGTHPEAVAARTRVVELGGAAAVNLSAGVTDVVVLDGGETDRRLPRITALLLPIHDAAWLIAPVVTEAPEAGGRVAAHVLPRGGVVDLPLQNGRGPAHRWTVTASWAQQTACDIDVVAFVLDEDEQVSFDEDFVFYGAPENPGGTVRLLSDGPTEQTISVDLATLPPSARKVVVAAAVDGSPVFGDVGALHIVSGPGSGAAALVQATLDAATTERTMLLAEIYRRGQSWRLRAVGQGYDHGLEALARGYGVDVAG